jgi:ADP-ribose pyrophosphatase
MSDPPYQTLSSRLLWTSPWYSLREDQVRFPDGSQGVYTVVEKRDAVWVVPALADGRLVLIRNYRYTVGEWLWEVPAGGIEPGIAPQEMARRELAEEVGGQAQSLEEVARFYTMPGIGDEVAHIFLARGVALGEPRHEPSEVMERHAFPLSAVLSMIHRGELADGPSALAVLLCLPHLETDG